MLTNLQSSDDKTHKQTKQLSDELFDINKCFATLRNQNKNKTISL